VTRFLCWSSGLAASLAFTLLAAASPARAADADDAATSAGTESHEGDTATSKSAEQSDGKTEAPAKDEGGKSDTFGHGGQFGLRAGIVLGYRMVLRYDSSPYCAPPKPEKQPSDQQKFCGYGAPPAMDFGLSFGALDFIEPFAWARFGLSADTKSDTNPLVLVGAGVRIYTMSDAAFKIFIEPAVALELESGRGSAAWQTNNPKYPKDFVFHLAAGPQFDFHKFLGLYVTGGLSMGVVRALASSLDLNIGIQGRLP
jgi:opacity protein-like surface antigen